jgi:hypothetical protein
MCCFATESCHHFSTSTNQLLAICLSTATPQNTAQTPAAQLACAYHKITHNLHGRLCLKCDGTRAETRFRLWWNWRVHLNRQGRQFSLLAAGVCASAVVMLDTPCSEVVWRVLATQSISQFPLHFPYPCVSACQHISTGLYHYFKVFRLTYNFICYHHIPATFITMRVTHLVMTYVFRRLCWRHLQCQIG